MKFVHSVLYGLFRVMKTGSLGGTSYIVSSFAMSLSPIIKTFWWWEIFGVR